MKAGWHKATLGEVCDVVNGGTPKTGVSANWGGRHMWITPAEMGRRADPYVAETERQLTDAGLAAANLLPPCSVILSSRAPIGHLVINSVPMATNQGCKGLVPKPTLYYKYLFYYLGSIVPLLNELGTGATFKELSGGKLKEVAIPLPPLPEQQRIVAILDEAFAGLATATANAEKNLKNAHKLFESYVDLVFQRQVNWERTTLGAVAEFKNGLNFTKSSKGEKIRIVGVKDFKNHFWVQMDELESAQIDGGLSEAYLLRKNDILTVRSNGNKQLIGRCILAGDVADKVSHSGFTIRIRIVSPDVEPVYLVRYLKSGGVRRALIESGDGAQISNLNQQALTALPVMLPSLQKQHEITSSLAELEAEAEKLQERYETRIADFAELKQAILQKAFSGELTSPPTQAIKEAAE